MVNDGWELVNLRVKNVVLIGMPGVGKSTIGVVLAKNLGISFVDSDIVIQEASRTDRSVWYGGIP